MRRKVDRLTADNKVLVEEYALRHRRRVRRLEPRLRVAPGQEPSGPSRHDARALRRRQDREVASSVTTAYGDIINTAVNVYPRAILDQAATELRLFKVRTLPLRAA